MPNRAPSRTSPTSAMSGGSWWMNWRACAASSRPIRGLKPVKSPLLTIVCAFFCTAKQWLAPCAPKICLPKTEACQGEDSSMPGRPCLHVKPFRQLPDAVPDQASLLQVSSDASTWHSMHVKQLWMTHHASASCTSLCRRCSRD